MRSGVSKVLNYLNGFTSAYLAIFPSLFFDKFVVDLYQIKEGSVFLFTGFNLKIDKDDESFFNSYFDDGQKLLASQKEAIQTSLESYICNNDILDGTKIQENWFHSVNADIFLSHSHKDAHLVVALAGWLKQNCHINAFVDSYIWGYANDLLKILDKRYCVQSQDGDHVTYDYFLLGTL